MSAANKGDGLVMIVCGLALLVAVTVAHAQGLPDPTRPPASIENPQPAAGEAGEGATASVLQAIIRREGEKPAAVIGGTFVVLGGKVGDGKLVRIGEDFVVVRGPAGDERLRLMAGVEKMFSQLPPTAKPAAETARKTVPAKEVEK